MASSKRARKRVLVIDGSPTAHMAVRTALDPEEYEATGVVPRGASAEELRARVKKALENG